MGRQIPSHARPRRETTLSGSGEVCELHSVACVVCVYRHWYESTTSPILMQILISPLAPQIVLLFGGRLDDP